MQNGLKRMFFTRDKQRSKENTKKNFNILWKYREKKLNIFAHFSISEHSASFSLFQKKPILITARGFAPPP